jgi:hypothetical protein
MEAGIDDQLNRLVAEFANRRDHRVCKLAGARVHHHDALIAHLHRDIASIAHQHVEIALHRQYMDLAVMWVRVYRATGARRSATAMLFRLVAL